MADAPAKKKKGKKIGPLTPVGWGAVAVGVFGVYWYIKKRAAATSSTAASGTTGGTTIPAGTTGTSTVYSTLADYEQALISALTGSGLGGADALNGVTNWLNGNCVSSAQYNGISAAISQGSIGLPPGFSSIPTLSVCSSSPGSGGGGGGTGTTAPDYSSEVLQGSGYWTPQSTTPVIGANGQSYSWIPGGDWQSVVDLFNNGTPLFYQPAEGVFAPFNPYNHYGANTPVYISQSTTPQTGTKQPASTSG